MDTTTPIPNTSQYTTSTEVKYRACSTWPTGGQRSSIHHLVLPPQADAGALGGGPSSNC
jgi:hypothetical protein